MPEPLAVAFVEVRPEIEDFRSDAESQLAGVGEEALNLQGTVDLDTSVAESKLAGVGEALDLQGEVDLDTSAAQSQLSTLARETLNLQGEVDLDTSGAEAQVSTLAAEALDLQGTVDLETSVAETQLADIAAETVDVQGKVDLDTTGFQAQVSDLAAETRGQFAAEPLAVEGAVSLDTSTAQAQVADLAAETQVLLAQLSTATSPEFAEGFVSGAEEAVAAVSALGEATGEINTEIVAAEAARRALAQTNLLAAQSERVLETATRSETRAVIEAEGAEREFFRTRARRSGSVGPLRLAGIGLGAGVALFTATQAIRELGKELAVTGDEADTGLGKLRNFGAGLLSGDIVGAFQALGNQARAYSADAVLAIDTSEDLAKALKEAGIALNEIEGLRESRLAAAETLTQVPQFLQTQIARGQAPGGSTEAQLSALRQAQEELETQEKELGQLRLSQNERLVALEAIFGEQAKIAGQIETLTKEARPDILAPLVEAVTDARLTGDQGKILAALRREATVLEGVIAAEKTNAEDRRKFKDALEGVNRDIETTQDQILAEEQRHQEAMLDKLLDIGVLEDLESQAGGGASTEGRSRRAAAIQAALDKGTIDGKRLTREQKERLNAELIAINAGIESEQDAIATEAKRHADEMKQKLADADQAFLDAIGGEQRRIANEQLAAAATAQLGDDIRLSNVLQATFRRQIAEARKTIADAKLKATTIADLNSQLEAEERSESALRRQQRRENVDRREESLDLNIQLAQANENTAAERRAHEAKIKFLQERIRHTREGTNQRKALRLEIAREKQAIKDLTEDEKEGASFDQLAFDFLQNLEGFSSNLASNTMAAGTTMVGRSSSNFVPPPSPIAVEPPVTPPAGAERQGGTPSPFEAGRASGTSTAGQAASELRDSRGAPINQSQGEELIHLGKRSVRLLERVAGGLGHQESRVAQRLSENTVSTSVD